MGLVEMTKRRDCTQRVERVATTGALFLVFKQLLITYFLLKHIPRFTDWYYYKLPIGKSQAIFHILSYNVFMKIFCERFRELRQEHNLTIQQLAEELGVSIAAVSRWETGARVPSIDSLYIIAKYFDVTTDYLVGLED